MSVLHERHQFGKFVREPRFPRFTGRPRPVVPTRKNPPSATGQTPFDTAFPSRKNAHAMKSSPTPTRKSPSRLFLLAAVFLAAVILPAQAQFKVLKAFPESALDGANPVGRGAIIGNQYFGTTKLGGIHGKGVLYRINLDGTGFAKLKDFTVGEGGQEESTSLLASGDFLFGVLQNGEHGDKLYSIDSTGENFRILFKFSESLGYDPRLHFIDGTTIYGTCYNANSPSQGTVFKINADGSGFHELVVFQGGADGAYPAQIVDGGNVIYGITAYGGIPDKGTIFKVNKDGTGYQQIHYMRGDASLVSLALLNGKLFVCSSGGGEKTTMASVDGFVFSINPDGSGYRHLKTFDIYSSSRRIDSLSKVSGPDQIITHNNQIHGLAGDGRSLKEKDLSGGLFRMNLDGTGYVRIFPFSDLDKGSTGKSPSGFIIQNGVLYGTNYEGGSGGVGTLYSYTLGGGSTTPTEPLPTTQEMYGTATFTASEFSALASPSSVKTSKGVETVTEPSKMARVALTTASILAKAVQDGLIPSADGYSIVCPDTSETGLEFFAYKKGAPLVSLSPILSLTEVSNVQAANTVTTTNTATGTSTVARSGTEKSYATGTILGVPVAVNRSIAFKTGTARLNGTTYTYYPSTSTASFFGGTEDGTRFLEGRFTLSASKPIEVPAR